MRKCTDCNYSTNDGICLHESARFPDGIDANISMATNRAIMDTMHCGREGRYWQPRELVWPTAPTEG